MERNHFPQDNCTIFNINGNPKGNILVSEKIKHKSLTILEYFDACICHDYHLYYNLNGFFKGGEIIELT